ncbi:MAG: phosphoribosyltransferase [Nanoarchaeota archaeon]|nr:phosphoribosyltransferase [Nanoarchaeota archaeon]
MVLDDYWKARLSHAADELVYDVKKKGFDSIIFLDKSARAYAALFKSRWKANFPDEKIPEVRFADVGREKTGYSEDPRERLQRIIEKAKNTFKLEGQEVLIFDDFYSTGKTMATAMHVFSKAFPKTHFYSGTMGGHVMNRDRSWNGEVDIGPYLPYEAPTGLPEGIFRDSREGITISTKDDRKKLRKLRKELVDLRNSKGLLGKIGDTLRAPFRKNGAGIHINDDKESWGAYYLDGDDRSWRYPHMDTTEIRNHPYTYRTAIDKAIAQIDKELETYEAYPKLRKEMQEIGKEKTKEKLEKMLVPVIALILLSLPLLLKTPTITGNSTLEANLTNQFVTQYFIILLFVTALLFFWIRRNKKS